MDKYTYEDFLGIVAKLRAEDGCPWDRKQTHESLRPCMTEETAELIASIRILNETGSYENMREELGDILLQVVMHSTIAEEEGYFTMEDVVNEISEKMIRRHPHVFKGAITENDGEIIKNWEEIKVQEKAGKTWIDTPLKEIPYELPALARAVKVMKKTDRVYNPLPSDRECLDRIASCAVNLGENASDEEVSACIGDILMSVAQISAAHKLYAEQILADRVEEHIAFYEKKK